MARKRPIYSVVEPADKVNNIVSIVSIVGDDGSLLTDSATTRLRGNASMQFPKKPYRIKFAHKQRPLGFAACQSKKCTNTTKSIFSHRIQNTFLLGYSPTDFTDLHRTFAEKTPTDFTEHTELSC